MFNNPQHTVQFEFLRSLGVTLGEASHDCCFCVSLVLNPLPISGSNSMTEFWNKVADRSSSHPLDWLVLAMRENIQLSFSSGVISAHVQSSLWAYQFWKVIKLVNEPLLLSDDASFCFSGDLYGSAATSGCQSGQKAFHQHVFKPMLNAPDNPRTHGVLN